MFLWVLVAAIVALLLYIRLAPSDVAKWHRPISAIEKKDMDGGAIRVINDAPQDSLARVSQALADLPRTEKLAGSVEEGRVTYVTRSKMIGFPDYTTLQQDGSVLKMKARLRFGRSDFGVNRARLERLITALQ